MGIRYYVFADSQAEAEEARLRLCEALAAVPTGLPVHTASDRPWMVRAEPDREDREAS